MKSPAPTNPKSSDLSNYLPNLGAISDGAAPISLGIYDRTNKLPYTYNYSLDVQWQPRNDLAIEFGYVGNLGRHQVIPVPFNQPGIASAAHPIHGGHAISRYTYGYTRGCVGKALNGPDQRAWISRTCWTTKAAMSTTAFRIPATRRSRSTTRRPAWTATTR